MNVAVDARELCGKPTGVGRYLGELLTEWATLPDARRHQWTLYAHDRASVPAALGDRLRLLPGRGGTAWEQWVLARALARDRPDVLFAPGYTAPLTAPCPLVVAIHDVSFAAHPEWFSRREGWRRRAVTAWTARRARAILTISQFSKAEIARWLAPPPGCVHVIPPGVRRPARVRSGPRPPVILYVGSIFPRRHVDVLVDAFATMVAPGHPDARLEIVGDNRLPRPARLCDALNQAPPDVRARVCFRSYVDDATRDALYQEAAVFAFLSEYEGFGFTPLEALAHGVAPVVLDTAVAREVLGPAARYVSRGPLLARALGDVLVELLESETARAALVSAGDAVLSRYDWTLTAAATLAVLEDAALGR